MTVTVTDVDEAGVASIDRPQPQVGRPLSAGLLDDDGIGDGQEVAVGAVGGREDVGEHRGIDGA